MHIYNNSSAPKHSIILIVCFALILHNVSLEKQDFIVIMLGVVELTSINQLRSRLVSTSNNWLHKLVCGSSVIVMDITINSKIIQVKLK